MKLKRFGAAVALVLFCSILCTINSSNAYAKDGYRVSLRVQDSTGTPILKSAISKSSKEPQNSSLNTIPYSSLKTATLTLARWESDTIIGTATISDKSEFIFSGKQPLVPGEYIIKWNKQSVEFFVSDSNIYVNEKLVLRGKEIIQKKGSLENAHLARFQNLVNYEWRELDKEKDFVVIIDSIGISILENKELDNTLLHRFMEKFNPGYAVEDGYHTEETFANYLTDNRITNTNFGKTIIPYFFKEFSMLYYRNIDVITETRNFINRHNISKEMASRLVYEGFKYYTESEIMGEEANACKLYEAFFKNGELEASNEKMFEMRTFYMLNKSSLLGMQAPELEMKDTYGITQSLQFLSKMHRYTILYFYSHDCLTCKIETPKLVDFVNNYKENAITVYAVYTQDNKEKWTQYIADNLQISNQRVQWINVWDPKIDTGFHLLYNVVSTPQMYLIDCSGTIIGRRLNTKALEELITRTDNFMKK